MVLRFRIVLTLMLGIGRPTDRTSCLLICAAPPLHPCGSLASHRLRRPPPPHLQLPDPLRRPPPRRSAGRGADGIGATELLLVAWLAQLRAEVLLRARPGAGAGRARRQGGRGPPLPAASPTKRRRSSGRGWRAGGADLAGGAANGRPPLPAASPCRRRRSSKRRPW